jgi:hypothetical protein
MTHPSVWQFSCPTCGAREGSYCKDSDGEWTHKRRQNRMGRLSGPRSTEWLCGNESNCGWPDCGCPRSTSVPTVSGGAFEMNRRRH